MTILSFPVLSHATPPEIEWTQVANTQTFTSPLSGAVQTVEMPGVKWKATFPLRNLTPADAAKMRAFYARLRGRAGRFYLYNFAHPSPRGTASGSAFVKGASQAGTSLAIDGLAAGATLLAGDFFEVSGELKVVVADVTANGSGEMTLTFEPPLRASPGDNATVTLTQPKATMMLEDDAMRMTTRAPFWSESTISCIEAF